METEARTAPVLRTKRTITLLIVVAVSMLLPWLSAADHSLYSPDEGRYATVAAHMADGGSWLVPEFRGEAHLTKPPMAYWMMAISMKTLGRTTLAARAPSLLAGSLCVLIVFLIGRAWRGPVAGAIAAGALAVMPLFVLTSRFAVTDPMLNCCWVGALGAGWMAMRGAGARYAALLWVCVALGLLVKGPAALIPALSLLLWALLARDRGGLRRLRIWVGLPLAALPLVAWGVATLVTHDDALAIWRHEVVDRAVGEGDHTQPMWFFVPVFLAGLYPATAMLVVPGFNITWERARMNLRSGETEALWAISALVPFVIFSLIAGKLPSYILPVCAPIALLTAGMLLDRIRLVDHSSRFGFKRSPDVVVTLAATSVIFAAAGFGAALYFDQLTPVVVFTLALAPVGAAIVWEFWSMAPARRGAAVLLAWSFAVALWALVLEQEDRVGAIASPQAMLDRIEGLGVTKDEPVAVVGFHDPSLAYYLNGRGRHLTTDEFAQEADAGTLEGLVFVDAAKWEAFEREDPVAADRFEVLENWPRRWTHPTLVLRNVATPAGVAVAHVTQPVLAQGANP